MRGEPLAARLRRMKHRVIYGEEPPTEQYRRRNQEIHADIREEQLIPDRVVTGVMRVIIFNSWPTEFKKIEVFAFDRKRPELQREFPNFGLVRYNAKERVKFVESDIPTITKIMENYTEIYSTERGKEYGVVLTAGPVVPSAGLRYRLELLEPGSF